VLPFSPAEVEVVEFEAEEFPWITIRLKDGSVLRFKVVVTGVMRLGNDPNTGIPVYTIQTQGVIQMVKVPKELVKRPGQPGVPGPAT